MALFILLIMLALPLLLCWYEMQRRKLCSSLPPGPPSLPFLGNILLLIRDTRPEHKILEELSDKYGDIMTFWDFMSPIIVVSSVDAIREAYVENAVSDRPPFPLAKLALPDVYLHMVVSKYNDRFRKMQKALVRSVRSAAISSATQSEIVRITQKTIRSILNMSANGSPVNFHDAATRIIYEMATYAAFGKSVNSDDPGFLKFRSTRSEVEITTGTNSCLSPTAKLITISRFRILSAILEMRKLLHVTYRHFVADGYQGTKHNAGITRGVCVADGLVEQLEVREKSVDMPTRGPHEFEDDDVVRILEDMFVALGSSTPSTLMWLILEMVQRPDVQERCQEEIRNVLQGRPATIADRRRLPYIEACVTEAIRCHITAISMPHCTRSKTLLRGYEIPAKTRVAANLRAAHHDTNTFKNPQNFDPENFLDANGEFSRPKNMALFGLGQRACPGETLAKTALFLSFATLMQNVSFRPVKGLVYNRDTSMCRSSPNACMALVEELPISVE